MSLGKRTTKATIILLTGYGTSQSIRLGGNLVTTKLLSPELFGVMLLANAFLSSITMLSDAGLSLSVLRHKDGDKKYFLQTTFILKASQGFILALLLLTLSFMLGLATDQGFFPTQSVYANINLQKALLVLSATAFINGLTSIELDVNKRNMLFGKIISLEIFAQIIAISFIIYSATHNPSIYSLALATTISTSLVVIGSYAFFSKDNVGISWDKSAAKEIFNFGKWIAGSSMVGLISQHGDKLIFGYILTPEKMGHYAIATLIFGAIDSVIKRSSAIYLPMFSEVIRETPNKISKVYYKVRLIRDLIISGIAGILIIAGAKLIHILYDDRYADAGWMLQLLGISLLINLYFLKGQIITAMGDSHINFRVSLQRAAGTLIIVPIMYWFFGTFGAILAVSIRFLLGTQTVFGYFHGKNFLNLKLEARTLIIISLGLGFGFIFSLLIDITLQTFVNK